MTSSITTPFFGYTGTVWGAAYQAFNYLAGFISQNPPPDQIEEMTATVATICLNSLNAINANLISEAWSAEIVNLQEIQALPLSVPPDVASAFNNRVTAYILANEALQTITPTTELFNIPIFLNKRIPAISDIDLLTYYQNFNYETLPAGTTNTNLASSAQTLASNFLTLSQAVSAYQGFNTTPAYDASVRLYNTAAQTANVLSNLTSGPFSSTLSVSGNWNQLVTLPALVSDAYLLASPPFTLAAQQQEVVRYILLMLFFQLSFYLLILRQPPSQSLDLALVLQGDSLMDVAARHLGDFEQWRDIAVVNNLFPPYVGPSRTPGLVAWGDQVILPSRGGIQSPVGTVPDYNINFLGNDIYIGQINGEMPPWTGDFQTINGYNNLRISLGRRLQTTIGSLIYHNTYGSRIPPQVGVPQTSATSKLINAFGNSAILSDPRVAQIISSITQLLPNFEVSYQAAVQPAGFGTNPVAINEVLSPSL